MATFFPLQLRRCICRSVLFTVFWELSIIVNKCTSNQGICISSNRRSISHFEAELTELIWFTAWQKCNLTSSLTVICDESEQRAIMSFLNAHGGISSVWTSGQKVNFTEWTWIDGHIHRGMVKLSAQHDGYTHVALERNFDFIAHHPQHVNFYLCQYSGSPCRYGDVVLSNNRCVRPSYDQRTWFNARNHCLLNGGDLAILYDDDLATYRKDKLYVDRRYWIGLRKNTWRWRIKGLLGHSVEEIKYTNWLNDPLYGDCISINASTGQWNAVGCADKKMVVCQSRADERTSSTSSEMATSRLQSSSATSSRVVSDKFLNTTSSPIVANTSSSTTSRPSPTLTNTLLNTTKRAKLNTPESATTNATYADSRVLLYSGVGAGIVFIIICIIVIILVVRHTKKSNKDVNQSKIKNKSKPNRPDISTNNPASSPANHSSNTQLTGADDPRGVYAEISLATPNEPELISKIEQPGIVYASLDFQKEPSSMKPDKRSTHASGATK